MPDPCPQACRDYTDSVAEKVKEHAKKNVATIVRPIAEMVERHDAVLRGGSDGKPGLHFQSNDNRRRLEALEQTVKESMANSQGMLADIHRHLVLETTINERTPRGGTRVEVGDSDRPPKSRRTPIVDKDTLRLILIVVGSIAGVGGTNYAYQAMTAPPQQAVQVQAEAVAEKREDLAKRERELARREAWVARQVANRRTTEPTMPEPSPAAPVAPAGSAE